MTEIEVLRVPDGSIVIERLTVASYPSIRIQPAEKPALLTALLEDALEGTRVLKRNVLIYDEKGFDGEWIAIPRVDFDILRGLLSTQGEGGKVSKVELTDYQRRVVASLLAEPPNDRAAILTALLEDARKISDGDSYCCSLCHVATTNDLRPICTPCFDRITY